MIGEDSDLLILLLYHKLTNSMPVYLTGEEKSNMKSKPKIWDIHYAKEKLSDKFCDRLLTVHVLLCCDTTSQIHGVGKVRVFGKFKVNVKLRLLIKTSSDNGTKADIWAAGERLHLMLTSGVREKLWMSFGTLSTAENWEPPRKCYLLKCLVLLLMQLIFMSYMSVIKFRFGKVELILN